jgi:protein TonB
VPDLPSAIHAPLIERPDLDLALTLAPAVRPSSSDRDLANRLLILDVVDEPPRVTRRVLPEYPSRAELMGVTEGHVLIEIVVSAEGRVESVEVVEASPAGFFESVTLAAVRQWSFTPAIFRGRAVPVRARTEVTFTLEEW